MTQRCVSTPHSHSYENHIVLGTGLVVFKDMEIEMRKTTHLFVVVFTAVTAVSATIGTASTNNTSVGGQAAFASRADGMVSTVEGFLEAKEYAAAEKAATELTETNPDYVKGWLLLGYCQTWTKKYDESNEAYKRAAELGADEKTILTNKAYNFIRLGQYEDARTCYKMILDQNDDDVDALKQLGYVEGKLGNYNEAAHYYNRILDKNPNDKEVITAYAKIEAKRGGGSIVKELLEKSLELDPENIEALGKLGLYHIKQKNFKAAVAPLSTLVALEPDNIKAQRNLGVAYYELGDKANAAEAFSIVRKLGTEFDDLYGPLADCYQSTRQNALALEVIREGIANGTQRAWLYCMWGKLLESSKRYDEASEKFVKAAELNEAPWSAYAVKQVARQGQLKKRAQMMASQGM